MRCFYALILAASTFVFGQVTPAFAQTEGETLVPLTEAQLLDVALRSSFAKKWDTAMAQAAPAGLEAVDIIEWLRLRASAGTFQESIEFLRRRPDWPGLPLLRKRSEETIPATARVNDVLAFFAGQAPRTGIGSLRLAQAFRALGRENEAQAEAQRGWINFDFDAEQEAEFLSHFGTTLAATSHDARMNMLLWESNSLSALRMLPRVSVGAQKLALARLALQTDAEGLDAHLAAVPETMRDHPGLAYDRFQWRIKRKRRGDAIALLEATSTSAAALGRPAAWAERRFAYARDALWNGKEHLAYSLAANHYLEPGPDYAKHEWLAGYVALRKLNRADLALFHFQRHGKAVDSPISLGRSHYWQGRAWEVLGDTEAAKDSYLQGAQHQTAFYGLLSSEKIGLPLQPQLTGAEQFGGWENAAFANSSVFRAGTQLIEAGHDRLGVRFLTHLAESLDRSQIGQLTAMAEAQNNPYLALMLAKRGVKYGKLLERAYHPLHPVSQVTGDVPAELALAISRRESEFLTAARSGVGAQGLMQLMPPTAREMAGKIGVAWEPDRLGRDAAYNAKLGIAYLAQLQAEFGASPVQIAAAYNAGPSRPKRWMAKLGDPRRGQIDVIDFIEMIPFDETRNYVMRVTESLPSYQARLSGQVPVLNFTQMLTGQYVVPPVPTPRQETPQSIMRPVSRPASLATR